MRCALVRARESSAAAAILQRVSAWQRTYSDEQRDAIVRAACELQVRPWRRIVELAAAGELTPAPGAEPLPAFELRESSARTIARAHERRREGHDVPAAIANLPARDRAHALQLRLSGLVDHELARLERAQRAGRALDVDRCRQLARALRELATLPDPHEKRLPRAPGDREPGSGDRPESRTRDGLAGALLRSHARSSGAPARDEHEREQSDETGSVYTAGEHNENGTAGTTADDAAPDEHATTTSDEHDARCHSARVNGAGMTAELVAGVPRA